MDTKKVLIGLAVVVAAVVIYNKFIKKNEEPFIIAQEGGEAQTRPALKA